MAQKKRPGEKIKLLSVDELLGVPEGEFTEEIVIEDIHPFKNHPFRVVDDKKMEELVESIKHNGVLTPVCVRPDSEGGFEMISGHRRMHAAQLLGMEKIPAIIKELDDDDATIIMIDANIQREELLASEKAFAYKMRYEAMRRKAGRPSKDGKVMTGRNVPDHIKKLSQNETNFRSDEVFAEMVGESRAQIHRFIRLTELIPELLALVDSKKLPIMTAVDVSYLSEEIQEYLYEYIHENGMVKSYQVTALRKHISDTESITQLELIKILNDNLPGKTTTKKITFTEKKLRKYFPDIYSIEDMEKVMIRLLTQWKKEQGE